MCLWLYVVGCVLCVEVRHCDLALAVEVRKCPALAVEVRVAIWHLRLRSGSAHCDLALAVEVG